MTTPYERTRTLIECKQFLSQLADPARAPWDSAELQRIASWLLRHYPTLLNIESAHEALPDLYGPVPPFQRLHGKSAITELGLDKLDEQD
ncbi:MAG: BPSL0761 family protein [Rhodoferax sp.]|uniref:BPSL0761 family protein n=1 Tax=Rhodoferax sp. TaxID=50421 RepID=UPI002718A02B|nr:BPSL0761 family protein [Rhodoferax sp.]MDO8450334.1 BPSL0761 family protein [Rhodoferax sp.]